MSHKNPTVAALQERRRREVQEDVARGFTTEEAMARASHITAQIAEAIGAEAPAPEPLLSDDERYAAIKARHRNYAMNQLRDKAALISREYHRDAASGKLTGDALMRAKARMESYAELVTTLTKLKGLI